MSAYDLDLSAIPSGVLRHLKHNLRSANGDREDIYCIFVTGLYNIVIYVCTVFNNVTALFIFDI